MECVVLIVRSKGGNVTRSLEVWVKIRVRELSRVAKREEIDGGIEFENYLWIRLNFVI